jgi:hypothetical protein
MPPFVVPDLTLCHCSTPQISNTLCHNPLDNSPLHPRLCSCCCIMVQPWAWLHHHAALHSLKCCFQSNHIRAWSICRRTQQDRKGQKGVTVYVLLSKFPGGGKASQRTILHGSKHAWAPGPAHLDVNQVSSMQAEKWRTYELCSVQ